MTRRRLPLLALIVLASSTLAFGAAGYSTVEAPREGSIVVADDSSAYLTIESIGGTGMQEDATIETTVRNEFTEPVEVRLSTTTEPTFTEKHLDVGEEKELRFTLSDFCKGLAGDRTVTATLTAEGNANAADLKRSVTITCPEDDEGSECEEDDDDSDGEEDEEDSECEEEDDES